MISATCVRTLSARGRRRWGAPRFSTVPSLKSRQRKKYTHSLDGRPRAALPSGTPIGAVLAPEVNPYQTHTNRYQLTADGDEKVKSTTRFALFALASTLFAGCSAATSSSPQPPLAPASTGAGAQAADAARAAPAALSAAQPSNADEVFVSDQNANEVKIFGRDGKLLGAIPGFTTLFGLGADA